MGIRQKNRFLIPYFTLLPQIVVGSNLISVVPESLADRYSKLFHIHVFRPPYPLPPLESAMIRARNRGATTHLDWFRSLIRQVTS